MKLPLFEHHNTQDRVNWSEANEVFWTGFLKQFDEEIWPMYKKHGYSKDTALMHFSTNEVSSRLSHLEELLEANDAS